MDGYTGVDADVTRPGTRSGPKQGRYTAKYKLRIVREAEACGPGGQSALLRREGLHTSALMRFRRHVAEMSEEERAQAEAQERVPIQIQAAQAQAPALVDQEVVVAAGKVAGKRPVGRPPGGNPFDVELFEQLCHMQCTELEIAAAMRMDITTLEIKVRERYEGRKFPDVFAEKRQGGRCSLRRAQWKKAVEKEDTIMQIFLGKNYLGQADKQEIRVDMDVDVTITAQQLRDRARLLLPVVDAEAEDAE